MMTTDKCICVIVLSVVLAHGMGNVCSGQTKVYYGTDEEKHPIERRPPGPGENQWQSSNGPIDLNLSKGDPIWIAFDNQERTGVKKFLQLTIKGAASRSLSLKEIKGFSWLLDDKITEKLISLRQRQDKQGTKFTVWRYRLDAQPDWERFKFKARKNIVNKSIEVKFWNVCCRVKDKAGWPSSNAPTTEGSSVQAAATVGGVTNYNLYISKGTFGVNNVDAMLGPVRITEVQLFSNNAAVSTLWPASFTAYASTGTAFWTGSVVYNDPNGDSRPQGGVRFVSDGADLSTADEFSMQVFLTGIMGREYDFYAYDQNSGQWLDVGLIADEPGCTVPVDGFEAYNDYSYYIFDVWADGFLDPDNGSVVGNLALPYAEQNIVFWGNQSMPFSYDLSSANYAEAERQFTSPQDWSGSDIRALSIQLRGDLNNGVAPLYVELVDSGGQSATVVHRNPLVLLLGGWREWNINLSDFTRGWVDLTSVVGMRIGVGDKNGSPSSATGKVYIDEIWLCPSRCIAGHGPAGDVNDDCVVDFRDLAELGGSWLDKQLWP